MQAVQAIPERLERLGDIRLKSGAHRNFEHGVCAMELVSWLAGEKFSDHPKCASVVIGSFMRSWNDELPGDERDALIKPYIPHIIGTAGSPALELRRDLMALDWLTRVNAPTWLRIVGLNAQADRLAGLPDVASVPQTHPSRSLFEKAVTDAVTSTPLELFAGLVGVWPPIYAAQLAAKDVVNAGWHAGEEAARAWKEASRLGHRPEIEDLQHSVEMLIDRMLSASEGV